MNMHVRRWQAENSRFKRSCKFLRSIEAIAFEAIHAGFNDQDGAAWVRLAEPTARTTENCISWYRWKLRKLGFEVPRSNGLPKAAA